MELFKKGIVYRSSSVFGLGQIFIFVKYSHFDSLKPIKNRCCFYNVERNNCFFVYEENAKKFMIEL